MALESYQTLIELDTLYRTNAMGGSEQLAPTIWPKGGTVSVYYAYEEPTSDPLTDDMTLESDLTDLNIGKSFESVPLFMYVTGTATTVIATGIEAKEVV